MKQTMIGSTRFSKVLCGSNAFWGHSHFSEARNAEYRSRFSDEMIARVIQRCLDLGVNTVESCVNERIVSILSKLREQRAEAIRFVGSTRIDETSPVQSHQEKLARLIAIRADVCVIHAQFVDRPGKGARLDGVKQMAAQIHAAGLLAGISTHRVETVEQCEKEDCGIDTYLFPLNLSGFVYPGYLGRETVQERVNLVRSVAKPFILIKSLGAGRIPPAEGLAFIAENAKSNDLISLGFGTEDEISESLEWAEKLF